MQSAPSIGSILQQDLGLVLRPVTLGILQAFPGLTAPVFIINNLYRYFIDVFLVREVTYTLYKIYFCIFVIFCKDGPGGRVPIFYRIMQ